MIIKPEGLNVDIDIGGEELLLSKHANKKAFKLYNLRYLAFVIVGTAIITMLMWFAGRWYIGVAVSAVFLGIIIYLFVAPHLPKLSYFITTGRIGMAAKTVYAWYDYAEVKKVKVRNFAKTVTLYRGNATAPLKIDLYLSKEDFVWFVSNIIPKLTYAAVK
ncbi:MAG: hypothetical protein J1G04_04455 [Clostridiales bacterium]|nr:hypothetical protein [Clostridiales bacterium]